MTVGITDIAHSLRLDLRGPVPIPLGKLQQLVCAALGHKSLASFQAAQALGAEPQAFDDVHHFVPDVELLGTRALQLDIQLPPKVLQTALVTAFADRLPDTQVHESYDELVAAFHDDMQDIVMADETVNSEMANANYDGVREVYFELADDPDDVSDAAMTICVNGQVTLGIDTERPYHGHVVRCDVSLELARHGRRCFSEPDIKVLSASLDDGYDEPAKPSLAEAFAGQLGITVEEAQELVDVEPQELTGSSGDMTYGYLFDFTGHASPELAAKLMKTHGSLELEVGPEFFEVVDTSEFLY